MCRIKFYLYRSFLLKREGDLVFFVYEKGSKGKKGTFTRYVNFLILLLKLIFDRIFIPPPKKDWGLYDFCCPFGTFVRPVVTLFRLSDTLLNLTTVLLFFYFNSSPLNRLDVALMVPKFKRSYQVKRTDSRWINAQHSCSMVTNPVLSWWKTDMCGK